MVFTQMPVRWPFRNANVSATTYRNNKKKSNHNSRNNSNGKINNEITKINNYGPFFFHVLMSLEHSLARTKISDAKML